jgi:hypothetical protein
MASTTVHGSAEDISSRVSHLSRQYHSFFLAITLHKCKGFTILYLLATPTLIIISRGFYNREGFYSGLYGNRFAWLFVFKLSLFFITPDMA